MQKFLFRRKLLPVLPFRRATTGSTLGIVPTVGAVLVAVVAPTTEKEVPPALVIDALDLP